MFKGAIFDMDGLLFDTEQVYLEESIASANEFGIELDREYYLSLHGLSDEEVRFRYYQEYQEFRPEVIDEVIENTFQRVSKRIKSGQIPMKEGAHALVTHLHERKIPMTIASNNYPEIIKYLLDCQGITNCFQAIISSADVTHAKPHPEIVEKAVDILSLPKNEIVMFEDSLNGIRAAHSAQVSVIMVPDLATDDEEARLKTYRIIESLKEAKQFF